MAGLREAGSQTNLEIKSYGRFAPKVDLGLLHLHEIKEGYIQCSYP